MKPLLAVTAALALTAATAWTQTDQEGIRLHTNPKVPQLESLDRLNLTLAWSLRVKTEGLKDGLFSVQFLPGPGPQRMIVQTLRGDVVALDAETGDPLWVTHVGTPYELARPVGFNKQAIFATRKNRLFVLDRDSGKQLLWDIEKDSGQRLWGTPLESVPSAGPTADDQMVFLCMDDRVSGYFVPDFRTQTRLRAKEQTEEAAKRVPSPQVRRDWTKVLSPLRFSQPPLLSRDLLGLVADDGTFLVMNKITGAEGYSYQVEKPVVAPAAEHRNMAYIGSLDYHLYAFDMTARKLTWRFTGTAPVKLPVQATDRDVFVSPDRVGLFRLDRATGGQRWLARDARRFLATNGKFVYAFDRFGDTLVLDYERGTQLAKLDTCDFVFPVPNEWTDRLYLAAHNGLIVCLHHRDFPTPLKIRSTEEPVKLPPKGKGKGKKVVPKVGEGVGALPARTPGLTRPALDRRFEAPLWERERSPLLFRRGESWSAEGTL
jgi:outer membrane protein assembly factor BamB